MTDHTTTDKQTLVPAVGAQVERGVRPGALWDNERCIELRRLEDLLNEVSAINSGSNCLGRIAKCIELADRLNRTELGCGRQSFKHFLQDRAIEDRFGPRA
jgi:hypothetical protein